MYSLSEFASKIKTKYPVYAKIDDTELVNKVLEKYPIYRDSVDLTKTTEAIPESTPSILNTEPIATDISAPIIPAIPSSTIQTPKPIAEPLLYKASVESKIPKELKRNTVWDSIVDSWAKTVKEKQAIEPFSEIGAMSEIGKPQIVEGFQPKASENVPSPMEIATGLPQERVNKIEKAIKENDMAPIPESISTTQHAIDAFKAGDIDRLLTETQNRAFQEGWDKNKLDEESKKLEQLAKQYSHEPNKVIDKIVAGTARMLPMLTGGAAKGAIIGAAAAGATGAVSALSGVGLPATLPLMKGAFAMGQMAGSSEYWRRQGQAETYKGLLDSGVEPETAQKIAATASVPYALLEHVQVLKFLPSSIKGRITKSVTRSILESAAKYGKNVTEESIVEGLQKGITEAANIAGNYVEGDIKDGEMKARLQSSLKAATGEFFNVIPAMVGMSLPGGLMTGGKRVGRAIQIKKTDKAIDDYYDKIEKSIQSNQEYINTDKAGQDYLINKIESERQTAKNILFEKTKEATPEKITQKIAQEKASSTIETSSQEPTTPIKYSLRELGFSYEEYNALDNEDKIKVYESLNDIDKAKIVPPTNIEQTKQPITEEAANKEPIAPNKPAEVPPNEPIPLESKPVAPVKTQVEPISSTPETPKMTPVEEAYGRLIGKSLRKEADAAEGQAILDDLEEAGKTVKNVEKDFWDNTYNNLPVEVRDKFNRYIYKLTGMKVGDVIATGKGGDVIANSPKELLDLPTKIEHLEGTERGFVALMERANQIRKTSKEKPPTIKPPLLNTPEVPKEKAPTPKPLEQTAIAGLEESPDKIAIEKIRREQEEQAALEQPTQDLPLFNDNETARAQEAQADLFKNKDKLAEAEALAKEMKKEDIRLGNQSVLPTTPSTWYDLMSKMSPNELIKMGLFDHVPKKYTQANPKYRIPKNASFYEAEQKRKRLETDIINDFFGIKLEEKPTDQMIKEGVPGKDEYYDYTSKTIKNKNTLASGREALDQVSEWESLSAGQKHDAFLAAIEGWGKKGKKTKHELTDKQLIDQEYLDKAKKQIADEEASSQHFNEQQETQTINEGNKAIEDALDEQGLITQISEERMPKRKIKFPELLQKSSLFVLNENKVKDLTNNEIDELQLAYDRYASHREKPNQIVQRAGRLVAVEAKSREEKQIAKPKKELEAVTQEKMDALYEAYRNKPYKPKKPAVFGDIGKGLDKLVTDISYRLKKINPTLKARIREYTIKDVLFRARDFNKTAKAFIDKTKSISKDDFIKLDIALKHGFIPDINAIVDKYGMRTEFDAVRKILDALHDELTEAGLDVSYLKNYWPRTVSDIKGLIKELTKGKGKLYGDKIKQFQAERIKKIDEQIQEIQAKYDTKIKDTDPNNVEEIFNLRKEQREKIQDLKKKYSAFGPEEIIEKFDSMVRGYPAGGLASLKPQSAKERKFGVIPEFALPYYDHFDVSLIKYINSIIPYLAERKLFGKNAIINEGKMDFENSMGAFIKDLEDKGQITADEEQEVSDMLKALLRPGSTSPWMGIYRDMEYMSTLGNPIPVLTQLMDLSWSAANGGVFNTLIELFKKNKIVIDKDLGIENIAQELSSSNTSKLLDRNLRAIGFKALDRLGKNVFINTALKKYQAMAKGNPNLLRRKLEPYFQADTDRVLQEFKNGELTQDVLYMITNELLDISPATASEMPEMYHKAGNLKILYSLKSYSLKQLTAMRDKLLYEIKNGTPEEKRNAAIWLARYIGTLLTIGVGRNIAQAFLQGRDIQPEDIPNFVEDNILTLFLFNRYLLEKAKTKKATEMFWEFFKFPMSIIGAAWDDVQAASKGKIKSPKDLAIIKTIPIFGRLFYNLKGKGREIELKKRMEYGIVNEEYRSNVNKIKNTLKEYKDLLETDPEKALEYANDNQKILALYNRTTKYKTDEETGRKKSETEYHLNNTLHDLEDSIDDKIKEIKKLRKQQESIKNQAVKTEIKAFKDLEKIKLKNLDELFDTYNKTVKSLI